MKRAWIFIAIVLVLTAALFSAALHFGWIGHRSVDWTEFRNQVARKEYQELHISGQRVRAKATDAPEIIVDAPSEAELKALLYRASQHGVKVFFDQ